MTQEALALANTLLKHHKIICRTGLETPDKLTDARVNQSVIFYESLCKRAGLPLPAHSVGFFFNEITEWCEENGWPPLDSLAANRETGLPGEGYDGAPGSDLLLWPEHVRECIAFTGYPDTIAK